MWLPCTVFLGRTADFICFCFRTAPGKLCWVLLSSKMRFLLSRDSPAPHFCVLKWIFALCWNWRLFSADSLVLSHSLSSCLEIILLVIPSGSLIENWSIFCTKCIPLGLEYSATMCCWGGRIYLFLPFFAVFFYPLFVQFSTIDETFQ